MTTLFESDHAIDVGTKLLQQPETVLFRTRDGELMTLPAGVVDNWSESQRRWAAAPGLPRYSPIVERYTQLAWEIYYNRANGVNLLKPLPPRMVGRFQFWLRMNLQRLGLI